MPRTRRRKGATATGSDGQVLHNKPATAASSGVVPMVHPGEGAAGSTGEMLEKKAAVAAWRRGAPTMDPVKEASGSDSCGEIPQKKAAAATTSGGAPTMDPGRRPSGSDSIGEVLQKEAAFAALSGGARPMDLQKGLSCPGSSGGMLQKKAAAAAPILGPNRNKKSTAQGREESDGKYRTKKPRTVSSAKIPPEQCTEDEGDMSLSGGMLQKQSPKMEPVTGVGGGILHEHLAEEADTAKGIQESDSNEIAQLNEEDTRVQEVKDLIKQMDASCIGERISSDEFLGYYDQLACDPPWINLDDKLDGKDMDEQEVLHARYRLRYLQHKFKLQMSNGELLDDKLKSLVDISEEDCSSKYFEDEGFFMRFEEDMTIDWFFHRDYRRCSSLTEYQRLVLRNYGGTEYISWSEYHKYLHSYETDKEYLKYCKELSEKLKWMEDFFIYHSSSKWNCITSRGAFQAIKLAATGFQEITPDLAYNGFYECKDSMYYDAIFVKEYDDVYFEIWRRVTQKSLSFEDALGEVCKMKKFPLRQGRMEGALECDYTMMRMKAEYETCTEAITKKHTEDKARKLIAEAVQTRVTKPKSYEQYISKKIEIARVIGILPPEDSEE